ncbi:MAG: ATP-binding protein [Fretibacterium sp.]|nr:ATP-binding protein [Fretibacterium sp.]
MSERGTGEVMSAKGFSIPTEAEARKWEQKARDEIMAYIGSRWPDANEGSISGDIYSVLRAVRQERMCASCCDSDSPLCDGGRAVMALDRRERIRGGYLYTSSLRRCPRSQAGTNKATLFERLAANSRLSRKQLAQTFGAFNREGISHDVRRAYFMAMGAAEDGAWLALCGRRGTGKSHLAAAIALEVMRKKGQQAYFRLVPEMLDDLRHGYDDGDHDEQMEFLKSVPCLILDDLGKEHSTPAACDFLYQIIDSRYREGRQIILTTNARSKEELASWGDASFLAPLISRMDEMGDWVLIANAEDYRVKLGKARRENAA